MISCTSDPNVYIPSARFLFDGAFSLSVSLKEHVDIFNDTLIGCFVYFENVIGWVYYKLEIS